MTSLMGLCMRCPRDVDAMMCSSRGDNPDKLDKCEAKAEVKHLWPGFVDDLSSDPSTTLPDNAKCAYFVVDIYKQSKSFISELREKNRRMTYENQLKALMEWKSRVMSQSEDGSGSFPVSKQLLEYAKDQFFSKKAAGKRREEETSVDISPAVSANETSAMSLPSSTTVSKPSPYLSSEAQSIVPSASSSQPFSQETRPVLAESLAGISSSGKGSSEDINNTSRAIVSEEEARLFGSYLHPDTRISAFGDTKPDKVGVQPPWKCSDPVEYQKSSAAQPYGGTIHTHSSSNALVDTEDPDRNGTGGNRTDVVANYLQVTKIPEQVYEYSLAFGSFVQDSLIPSDSSTQNANVTAPPRDVTQRTQKEQIFKALRRMDPLHGRDDWATDYNTIWSLQALQDHEPVMSEILTTTRVDFHKFSGKPSKITGVTFCFIRKLNFPRSPAGLVSSGLKDDKGAPLHVTALNALLSSKVVARNLAISAGPNKFYARDDYDSFLGIQAHRGYFTSIRPGTQDILLNVSAMTGAFYQPIRVSQFMWETDSLSDYGHNRLARCEKLLVGRSVYILYQRASYDTGYDANLGSNRHRVIVELGDVPRKQMFGEGKAKMSVHDYFVKKLRANPSPSNNFPCVNVGVKRNPIWIPAEFVALDPDQPFARRLASKHMEKIHRVSLLAPAVTQDKIINNGFNLLGVRDGTFHSLNINIVPNLLLIPARFLPNISLLYRVPGLKDRKKVVPTRNASWNIVGAHLLAPGVVHTPVKALDFRLDEIHGEQQGLARIMTDAMRTAGMVPRAPAAIGTTGPTAPYWWSGESQSEKILAKDFTDEHLARLVKPFLPDHGPALHIVILQDKQPESYATIKRVFDQHIGSHTVCITAPKLPQDVKKSAQLLGNLAMKFNLKLGGINHLPVLVEKGVNVPRSVFAMLGADTMVVGADVSHAPSQMKHCPSVAAIVASYDSNYANFPGSMRLQASRQEFLQDLGGMMMERLLRYTLKNNQLPKKIVFFRDGVGEDMYDRVQEEEIAQIHSAYEHIRGNVTGLQKSGRLSAMFKTSGSKLQLTFIIVGKRHNTRFFCKEKKQGDDKGNVLPGLIVDRVITRPKLNNDDHTFDFFLQSHQALKGTARSAHYVVLQRGAFNVNDIQKLSHAFCYNYARATKGVSYAAPAYYADRLAERGTLYLKAYTDNKSIPSISMNKEELEVDIKRGERLYERRVAQHIQSSPEWNPGVNDPVPAGAEPRINPWHERMDDSMFWL